MSGYLRPKGAAADGVPLRGPPRLSLFIMWRQLPISQSDFIREPPQSSSNYVSASDSTPGARFLVSWLEIILGIGSIGIGAAYFAPLARDAFGDPHGMGATLGLVFLVFGLSFLVSGIFLRARGRWPWLIQSFPILAIALVKLFLV